MSRFVCPRGLIVSCALALLLIFSAGFASATPILESAWFTMPNGPLPGDPTRNLTSTDWNGVSQYISLAKFDSSLGVLNSVTLTLYADADSYGTITNNSGSGLRVNQWDAYLRVELLTPGAISVPATELTPDLLRVDALLVSLIPNSTVNVNGQVSYPNHTTVAPTSSTTYTSGTNDLSEYIGIGNIVFPLFTTTRTLSDLTGGNLDLTQTTNARAGVTIEYDYTPGRQTPEPATAVLLGTALVGISVFRRRRR
jgi:hypothetical protein